MLRRDDESVLRVALDFEVSSKKKRKPKNIGKKQVEQKTEKIGVKENTLNRAK